MSSSPPLMAMMAYSSSCRGVWMRLCLNIRLAFQTAQSSQLRSSRSGPKLPIVMLADHAHLPDAVLKSVDALVDISDPAHIPWAVVHFLLSVVPAGCHEANVRSQMPLPRQR